MDHTTYKIMHIAGLVVLALALGAALLAPPKDEGKMPKPAMILHGIGLIVMLVAGFGLLARLEIHWPWPSWVVFKLLIWLGLGALPTLVRKGAVPRSLAWIVVVALATTAAWLAIQKPEIF